MKSVKATIGNKNGVLTYGLSNCDKTCKNFEMHPPDEFEFNYDLSAECKNNHGKYVHSRITVQYAECKQNPKKG